MSATALIPEFRAGTLSPVEVLESQIARDLAHGAVINAFTERLHDEAREHARAAELRYRRAEPGEPLPQLLGVTVATKEKHQIAGHRIELGLLGHSRVIAEHNHPVVDRLRNAGAIIHARTTTPEYSCATVTHSLLWGTTRNPWNLEFSPGGSSGGAGAALAAGFTTLATASDIAGSTRLPAAFTGTVGYKAPAGRIPGDGPLAADWYRGDGPMGRTVADVALLTNVLSGLHAGDAASIPGGPHIRTDSEATPRLRVALSVDLGGYAVDADVARHTRRIAELLAAAGHTVEEVNLQIRHDDVHRTAFTHFGNILGPAMQEPVSRAGDVSAYTRRFLEDAATQARRNTLYDSIEGEHRIQQLLADVFTRFDLLICPTSAVAALDAAGDYLDGVSVDGTHLEHYWQAHMTLPFNIANRLPVLAVPSGISRFGIPTGVQLIGSPFAEQLVFSVGLEIERAERWDLKHPGTELGNTSQPESSEGVTK
ncbi:amidase [Leucobacter sp. 7(1)]|uniref:amidase n=1 Tax=Leucobacter sp. 7(1) TaxID=1255613 RepID=UPI000B3628F8|nr:amidase [Leucobacter sp. 7(1)]